MGRHKYIESPEMMEELFNLYKEWVKSNPFKQKDWVGKDGEQVYREKERPLTMEGFEVFCFKQGLNSELSHYFADYQGRYKDFVAICSYIKREIRSDQIEGGMAGMYNPSITQRLNGLVEKVQENGTKRVIIEVIDGDTENKDNSTDPA